MQALNVVPPLQTRLGRLLAKERDAVPLGDLPQLFGGSRIGVPEDHHRRVTARALHISYRSLLYKLKRAGIYSRRDVEAD